MHFIFLFLHHFLTHLIGSSSYFLSRHSILVAGLLNAIDCISEVLAMDTLGSLCSRHDSVCIPDGVQFISRELQNPSLSMAVAALEALYKCSTSSQGYHHSIAQVALPSLAALLAPSRHEAIADIDSVYVTDRILRLILRLATGSESLAMMVVRAGFLPGLFEIIAAGTKDSTNNSPARAEDSVSNSHSAASGQPTSSPVSRLLLLDTQVVHPLCNKSEALQHHHHPLHFSTHAEMALQCLRSLAVSLLYNDNDLIFIEVLMVECPRISLSSS
jgi:hypothetical protein